MLERAEFPVVWKKDVRMVLLLASVFICKIPSANAAFPQVKAVSRRKKSKDGQLVTVGVSIKDSCRRKVKTITCPQVEKNPKKNSTSKVHNPS